MCFRARFSILQQRPQSSLQEHINWRKKKVFKKKTFKTLVNEASQVSNLTKMCQCMHKNTTPHTQDSSLKQCRASLIRLHCFYTPMKSKATFFTETGLLHAVVSGHGYMQRWQVASNLITQGFRFWVYSLVKVCKLWSAQMTVGD